MDETRYPREGTSGNWAWAMVAPPGAVFSVLPSRARYVIDDLLGHAPQGVVVSDRYAAYGHLDASRRQLCWAHLLRDFTRIADRAGEPGRIGGWLLACGGVLVSLARGEQAGPGVRAAAAAPATDAGARRTADDVPAHRRDLRQPAAVVACSVDLPAPPAGTADEQRRRARAAPAGAQAQDLRAHPIETGRRFPRPRFFGHRDVPPPRPRRA